MEAEVINSAVYHCIEYSHGHAGLAEKFIACLRADEAWGEAGVDMVEYLALPIVNEPLAFQWLILPDTVSESGLALEVALASSQYGP
jgi:hypothetical protein